MEAHPKVPDAYREEYLPGQAEDTAWIVNVGGSATVPFGTLHHVLTSLEFTRLEPNVIDKKVYAPGIGVGDRAVRARATGVRRAGQRARLALTACAAICGLVVTMLGPRVPERRGGRVPAGRSDDAVPPCESGDLAVVVSWEHDGDGLRGQVIAENVGGRACRLEGKPGVTPLQPGGAPLPVTTTVTLEMLEPGYVILQPGERAAAPVRWGSWCGQQASDRARVDWPSGSTVAEVHGPPQPDCVQGRTGNLTTSWFELIR